MPTSYLFEHSLIHLGDGGQFDFRLIADIVIGMDLLLNQKIQKRHFLQDIQNSFEWATGIGLKMPQFFSF